MAAAGTSLKALLASNVDEEEALARLIAEEEAMAGGEPMAATIPLETHIDGVCDDCGDPAVLVCLGCGGDTFCSVCFAMQHRKGRRTQHKTRALVSEDGEDMDVLAATSMLDANELAASSSKTFRPSENSDYFLERAKHIPLRLTANERKMLNLLKSALGVINYTDDVDRPFRHSAKRVYTMLTQICAICSGVVVAADYEVGRQLVEDKEYGELGDFLANVFEIGRRHKIMNPEKMRGDYGKLIYLLQDTMRPDVQELLNFNCVTDIRTVFSYLDGAGIAEAVLRDPNLATATMEIFAEGKPRREINRMIKAKERAVEHIARKYATYDISAEEIRQCIYSIADNSAFLRYSRDPVIEVLGYLEEYFDPDDPSVGSLAISEGHEGARLTHNHRVQYQYVRQSLLLWREILHDFFRLWHMAETDLLAGTPYDLRDTGQGLNRVQPAPRTNKAMTQILNKVHRLLEQEASSPEEIAAGTVPRRASAWVGSATVHLGDDQVPNALAFISKYNQVGQILNPICIVLRSLDNLAEGDPGVQLYMNETFGGVRGARKAILSDFFQHAFDGAGDAGLGGYLASGSCIDGRLTSLWHYSSEIASKRYYPIFLFAGQEGFDGELGQ